MLSLSVQRKAPSFRAGLFTKIIVDGRERCGYGCREPWGGRKWEDSAYWEAWRLSRKLRQPRVIIHVGEVPLEYRSKLAHRIEEMS